ncbi:MAG: HNH endonuclease [Spirochaetota bacterium]|nr:HNH endonuclease [Spirochaetota bacterium]
MSNQTTIKNRTIFCGDNLDILQGFNDNSIDLIYLDPPFNKNKSFSAPIGSNAEGAEFKDYWGMEDIKDAWLLLLKEKNPELYHFIELSGYIGDKSNKYYLVYMAMRLLEMKRILKDTGSIYLHCDNTMGHYLKLLMDVIFGHKNFRNEIIWERSPVKGAKSTSQQFGRNTESVFFFSSSQNYYFNQVYKKHDLNAKHNKFKYTDPNGRIYSRDTPLGDYSLESIQRFEDTGRIYFTKNGKKQLIRFLDESKGIAIGSIWNDIKPINQMSHERVGYPTQKPLALLERIIEASCPKGGIVLDPFCGCATTCVAAEKLGREWVGIDISKKAYELVNIRLHKEIANPDDLFKHKNALIFRDDIPERTDIEAIKLIGKAKKEIKETLYGKQHGDCAGCKQHFNLVHMEVDHIIPKSKGGADSKDNFQLLCSYCNRVKGDRPMEELLAKLKAIKSN